MVHLVSSTWHSKDTQVSDQRAKSGKNSLKFVSTSASGGPTDLILPFNTVAYDKGLFEMDMQIFVVDNSAAYFQFSSCCSSRKFGL